MTTAPAATDRRPPARRRHHRTPRPAPASAVRALQVFCIVLFLFPSDTVLKAVGAAGFPAGLLALAMFGAWVVSILLGLHDPRDKRTPIRSVLVVWWLVCLASYATRPWQGLTVLQTASADRWLLLLMAMTGVALMTAECLLCIEQITAVLRALVDGAALCSLIGVAQFTVGYDVVPTLRSVLIGFQVNGAVFGGQDRGALVRVAGTATNPLELGTIAGALIPAAVLLAMTDAHRARWARLLPIALLGGGVVVSVSRSGVLALVIAAIVFTIALPPVQRVWMLAAAPCALAAVFVSTPGFLRTFTSLAGAGNNDPSIATRTNNYTYVQHRLSEHPWLGTGGGTYLADNALHVFDNEYLTVAVSLGSAGVVALLLLLLVPPLSALAARARVGDPTLRLLGAVLGGAGLAFAVCSATFDTLSFPMIAFAIATVLGLLGAYVRTVRLHVHLDDPGGPLPVRPIG